MRQPPTEYDLIAMNRIAASIKKAMKARGIRQNALAAMVEVSPMTIHHLLSGKHMPGFALVAKVATVLDISLDDLKPQPPKTAKKTA